MEKYGERPGGASIFDVAHNTFSINFEATPRKQFFIHHSSSIRVDLLTVFHFTFEERTLKGGGEDGLIQIFYYTHLSATSAIVKMCFLVGFGMKTNKLPEEADDVL